MTGCISTETESKKSQVWGLDLMIAMTIFLVGLVAFYFYAINFSSEAEENLDMMFYDGNSIASILVSEGSPLDWSQENVVSPGLASKSMINNTKLERFYSLASSDYNRTKSILKTRFDFYVYFDEMMNVSIMIDGIGKPGVNRTSIADAENPQNLVRIERFTVYMNKPTKMSLYLWQ